MKKYKTVIILLIIITSIVITILTSKHNETNTITINSKQLDNYIQNTSKKENNNSNQEEKNNYIAILEIPDINLKKGLVSKESKYNDVKYNIVIITNNMPNIINSNLVLASHSGSSRVSYFKDLHKLSINSLIYVYYNGYKYTYYLNNYYEVSKNKELTINRDKNINTLTLITCKDKYKQLIYICYLINKEEY